MDQQSIKDLLEQVAAGHVPVDEALLKLKAAPFEDLGFAKLDHHRALRQGAAEVIYGAGKKRS
jgi:NCAIR mutase (PurE)-related protein